MRAKLQTIGITIGDINGIGPEIILKTLSHKKIFEYCTPIIFGNEEVLQFYRKHLFSNTNFPFRKITSPDAIVPTQINVVDCWDNEVKVNFGEENAVGAKCAFSALQMGTKWLVEDKINALVTAPLCKKSIQSEGFKFPGQTEFVQNACDAQESLMFLVGDELKVATLTGHLSIAEVHKAISKEKLRDKLEVLERSLEKDFRLNNPLIAVLGLNPHAGEQGNMGKEEKEILIPVIKEKRSEGSKIFGPFSADAFFGNRDYLKFDAILAMYHDQGLIPFKMKEFDVGVNYTAGLPVVRTSPDHGTAFDIAGKGEARPNSFQNALFKAIDIVRNRRELEYLTQNPLELKYEKSGS